MSHTTPTYNFPAQDDIQTVTLNGVTSGDWVLRYGMETWGTDSLAGLVSAATLQASIRANYGADFAATTVTLSGTTYTITVPNKTITFAYWCDNGTDGTFTFKHTQLGSSGYTLDPVTYSDPTYPLGIPLQPKRWHRSIPADIGGATDTGADDPQYDGTIGANYDQSWDESYRITDGAAYYTDSNMRCLKVLCNHTETEFAVLVAGFTNLTDDLVKDIWMLTKRPNMVTVGDKIVITDPYGTYGGGGTWAVAAIEVLSVSTDGYLVHLGNGYTCENLIVKTSYADLSAIGGFTWQQDTTNNLQPIDWAQGVWSPPQADIWVLTIHTADTFVLVYGGNLTDWLAHDITHADLQTAIRGLCSETANVTVTGANGGPYTISNPALNPTQIFTLNEGSLQELNHTQVGNARFKPDSGTHYDSGKQSPWDEVCEWMTWAWFNAHDRAGIRPTLLSLVWWKENEDGSITNMGARTELKGADVKASNLISLFASDLGYGSPFPTAGTDTLKVILVKWQPFYWFPEIETDLNRISVPSYTIGEDTLGGFDVVQSTVVRKDLDSSSEASFHVAYLPYAEWTNPWYGVVDGELEHPSIGTGGYFPWCCASLDPDNAPNYYPFLYDYRWTTVPRLRKSIGTIEIPGNYDCLLNGYFFLNTVDQSASGTITLGLGITGASYSFETDKRYVMLVDPATSLEVKTDKETLPFNYDCNKIWTDNPPHVPEKIAFWEWTEPGDDVVVIHVMRDGNYYKTPTVVTKTGIQGVPLSISSDIEVWSHIEVANKNVPRDYSWTSFPDYGTIGEVSPGCGGLNAYSEFVFRGITSSCVKITISGVVRGSACQTVSPNYDPTGSRNGDTILGSTGPNTWHKEYKYPNCYDGLWHDNAYFHNFTDSASGCVHGGILGSGTSALFYGATVSLGSDPVMVDRTGLDPIASTNLFNVTLSVQITAAGGATWKKVVAANQIPLAYQESAPYVDTDWHQRSMTYIGTNIDVTFTSADLNSTEDQASNPDDYGAATIRIQSENPQDPPTGGESVYLCGVTGDCYPKSYACSDGSDDHFVEVHITVPDILDLTCLCEKDLTRSTWQATVYRFIFGSVSNLNMGTAGVQAVYGVQVTLCDYSYSETIAPNMGGKIEFLGADADPAGVIYCWVNNPYTVPPAPRTIAGCIGLYTLGGYNESGTAALTPDEIQNLVDLGGVDLDWANSGAQVIGFQGSGE